MTSEDEMNELKELREKNEVNKILEKIEEYKERLNEKEKKLLEFWKVPFLFICSFASIHFVININLPCF